MNKILKILSFILIFSICNKTYAQIDNNFSLVEVFIIYNTGEKEKQIHFELMDIDKYTYGSDKDKTFYNNISSYNIDGIIMIPLRNFAEGFGYDVLYQVGDKKIIIRDDKEKNEWIFLAGSTDAIINGQPTILQQSPIIRDNRAFIPLNYTSELFNMFVTSIGEEDGHFWIWISMLLLLTDDDVAVENNNFYNAAGFEDPLGFLNYNINNDGQTYRGIRIGDSYNKVVELYGEPHELKIKNDESMLVVYYTLGFPRLTYMGVLTFYISNNNVINVTISGH